jgi:hypothetical protein
MTKKFDEYCKKITEDLTAGGVLGNSGPYDTSDPRVFKIIGPVLRRKTIHKKRKKIK